jgi:vacuolar-type H+-ATPase subunit I/STV1
VGESDLVVAGGAATAASGANWLPAVWASSARLERKVSNVTDDELGQDQRELEIVNQQISELSTELELTREQLGEEGEMAGGFADQTMVIEQLSSQQDLLEGLNSRRAELETRIAGESSQR